jgi:hypothetical protein
MKWIPKMTIMALISFPGPFEMLEVFFVFLGEKSEGQFLGDFCF